MRWLWVSLGVLVLDQYSKVLVDSALALHESIELIPSLALRKVYNSGAAFSFLSDASGWQRWFFIALAVAGRCCVDRLAVPAAEKPDTHGAGPVAGAWRGRRQPG